MFINPTTEDPTVKFSFLHNNILLTIWAFEYITVFVHFKLLNNKNNNTYYKMSYQNSSNGGCGMNPSNGYPALNQYSQGSARNFSAAPATKQVLVSSYGGVGYSDIEPKKYGCKTTVPNDTSSYSGYINLGPDNTTYYTQPHGTSNSGYRLLCDAYAQSNISFAGPYSARQCLKQ
jgi:hypothetical protein